MSQATEVAISVRQFEDYRIYLREVIRLEQAECWGASVERFATRFGMSRSALTMILNGKRDLTVHSLHRVAQILKLDPADHEYFEALVLLNQAETDFERSYHRRRLETNVCRPARETSPLRSPARSLIANWYVPAVLVYLLDHPCTPEEAARATAARLGVPEAEVSEAIANLEREGFLEFRGKGNVHIAFDRLTASLGSKAFLKGLYQEAIRRLSSQFDAPGAFFTGHTFTLPMARFDELVRDYKELLNRHIAHGDEAGAGEDVRVLNACFQVFPVL